MTNSPSNARFSWQKSHSEISINIDPEVPDSRHICDGMSCFGCQLLTECCTKFNELRGLKTIAELLAQSGAYLD